MDLDNSYGNDSDYPSNKKDIRSVVLKTIENHPMHGWAKEIIIRSKTGQVAAVYRPPGGRKLIRTKVDLEIYLSTNGLPRAWLEKFEFKQLFCVCHQPENYAKYFSCVCGMYGCNTWFHAKCIGIDNDEKLSMWSVGKDLICPLCTKVLRDSQGDELRNPKYERCELSEFC